MKNWKVWQHDTGTYITAETVPPGEKLAPMIAKINGHNPANARLIAAAPELLEALQNIVGTYNDSDRWTQGDEPEPVEIQAARAAIAKATGDAQI